MIGMQEIVATGVSAEGFTPIMVYTEQTPVIYNGKCIGRIYGDHIHDPNLKVLQSSCKSAETKQNSGLSHKDEK